MVKYIRDTTGRFRMRPYYETSELDQECERIITSFMREKCGGMALPISTDVITKLIERDAKDLDLYADLSTEGPDVEGVTDFYPGQKPRVRIAEKLSQDQYKYRLRTTLTHEYGHVKFHSPLWDQQLSSHPRLLQETSRTSPKCKRDGMLDAPMSDWMEWQAGYICGALLMPIGTLKHLVMEYVETHHLYCPINVDSLHAIGLRNKIATHFDVSHDAARVRLLKLRYVTNDSVGPSLFG